MTVYSGPQIRQLCAVAGFPADVTEVAAAIALAESGGNTDAVNNRVATRAVGLWQIEIRQAHKDVTEEQARDARFSTSYALHLWQGRGRQFTDWTAYNNGSYKRFLPIPLSGQNGEPGASPQPGPTPVPTDVPAPDPIKAAEDAIAKTLGITVPSQAQLRGALLSIGVLGLGVLLVLVGLYGIYAEGAVKVATAAAPIVKAVA